MVSGKTRRNNRNSRRPRGASLVLAWRYRDRHFQRVRAVDRRALDPPTSVAFRLDVLHLEQTVCMES